MQSKCFGESGLKRTEYTGCASLAVEVFVSVGSIVLNARIVVAVMEEKSCNLNVQSLEALTNLLPLASRVREVMGFS